MDVLWAPWRMEYIDTPKPPACVFCAMRQALPAPNDYVLWRGQAVFCVLNRYPYNPGHLMVVVGEHTDRLAQLPAATQQELMWVFGQAVEIVRTVLKPTGLNAGLNIGREAGAGIVDHLHFHIVPRWAGDTNFMPVLAETRAMPEHLAETYRKLAPAFATLERR